VVDDLAVAEHDDVDAWFEVRVVGRVNRSVFGQEDAPTVRFDGDEVMGGVGHSISLVAYAAQKASSAHGMNATTTADETARCRGSPATISSR
jgi:hypothetical protein